MRRCSRQFTFILAIVGLLAFAASPALAQGGGTASSLSGLVVDTSGAVIPGADIVAKNNGTNALSQAVTDSAGRFTIPSLPPGIYTVKVSLMGFKTWSAPDVQLISATPGERQGRARGRRARGDRRGRGGHGDRPDAVGGGPDDDRREADRVAAARHPHRARLRRRAAGRRRRPAATAAIRRSTACRPARSTSRSTASTRRTTTTAPPTASSCTSGRCWTRSRRSPCPRPLRAPRAPGRAPRRSAWSPAPGRTASRRRSTTRGATRRARTTRT